MTLTKPIILSALASLLICCQSKKEFYSQWVVQVPSDTNTIQWISFKWANDSLGGRPMQKTSIQVPVRLKGMSQDFVLQFDTGADLTGIKENTLRSVWQLQKQDASNLRQKGNASFLQDFEFYAGNYTFRNEHAFVFEKYGQMMQNLKDTISLGTIGADILQDKVLIIDYPNQKLAIAAGIPKEYNVKTIPIEMDKNGRPLLPIQVGRKKLNILFDTGASIFPLLVKEETISEYSNSPVDDSLKVRSWGKFHYVKRRKMDIPFLLGGKEFKNQKVYSSANGQGVDPNSDGVTGNALFLDHTVIVDFKNKKFGIK
ncbi:MAG: hypothetical protein QM710_02995 [Flavobacterium sp.]